MLSIGLIDLCQQQQQQQKPFTITLLQINITNVSIKKIVFPINL